MTHDRIFGIDPGIYGGVAVLNPHDPFNPATTHVARLPTKPHPDAIGNRKVIEPIELRDFVEMHAPRDKTTAFAGIERVASMPTDGHVGAFAFGRAVGSIETTFTLHGAYIVYTSPISWKSSFRLSKDKQLSTTLATRLFPFLKTHLKNHNMAEALLIALYTAKEHFKQGRPSHAASPQPANHAIPAFLE